MYALRENYLESEVMTASPVGLIRLLYRGAVDAVRAARACLKSGDITERSAQITKAGRILTELAVSLDHAKGGEISRGLAELYDYMQRRLNEANFHQTEPPLAEVEGLLTTLLEAWERISSAESEAAHAYVAAAVAQPHQAFSYSY
ncbi:MAG TPA: flagellar export chaperone FliS [Bryobacteraceae bacterium]|jgi:flagellar protein FliS|nr:flagellar export chaperone FliS [Bryobacteraceae bacterium]